MNRPDEGIHPIHEAEMACGNATDRHLVVELEDIHLTEGVLDVLMAFGEVTVEPATRLRRAA